MSKMEKKKKKRKWEVTDLKKTCPEEHLSQTKSGFASEEGYSGCKSHNIVIRGLKEMFSAKCNLSGIIKRIRSTGEAPQRISSHLVTTISRALQARWQDSMFPGQKSFFFFSLPTLIFC